MVRITWSLKPSIELWNAPQSMPMIPSLYFKNLTRIKFFRRLFPTLIGIFMRMAVVLIFRAGKSPNPISIMPMNTNQCLENRLRLLKLFLKKPNRNGMLLLTKNPDERISIEMNLRKYFSAYERSIGVFDTTFSNKSMAGPFIFDINLIIPNSDDVSLIFSAGYYYESWNFENNVEDRQSGVFLNAGAKFYFPKR